MHADQVAASATLGRRVRVERARDVLEGDAVALTELGHLVVRTGDGVSHTVIAGDVVHLRPTDVLVDAPVHGLRLTPRVAATLAHGVVARRSGGRPGARGRGRRSRARRGLRRRRSTSGR